MLRNGRSRRMRSRTPGMRPLGTACCRALANRRQRRRVNVDLGGAAAGRAGRGRLDGVDRHKVDDAAVQAAAAHHRGAGRKDGLLAGVEDAVAVQVLPIDDVGRGALDEEQFLHRLQRRALALVRVGQKKVILALGAAGADGGAGAPPVDDRRGELVGHLRQPREHVEGGRVQVQPRGLIGDAEGVGHVVVGGRPQDPESAVAQLDRLARHVGVGRRLACQAS